MEKLERKIMSVILVIVVILALFLGLIDFISDFMWFKEMGYTAVFFKQLVTQLTVGVPTFIVVTGLVMLYLHHLRKSYFSKIASSEATDMKKLKKTTNILAVAFGAIATFMTVAQLWFEILKFANSSNFDIKDPLFHLDVSFYLFKLEFLTQLNEIMIGVIVGFVILTIIYYIILMTVRTPDVFKEEVPPQAQATDEERYTGGANPFGGQNAQSKDPFAKFAEAFTGKKFEPKPLHRTKQFDDGNFKQLLSIASGKISILGFIFFAMLGVNFFLRQFDLLHAHTGAVYGAGFTDVTITLWMYRVLCALAALTAILFPNSVPKRSRACSFPAPYWPNTRKSVPTRSIATCIESREPFNSPSPDNAPLYPFPKDSRSGAFSFQASLSPGFPRLPDTLMELAPSVNRIFTSFISLFPIWNCPLPASA